MSDDSSQKKRRKTGGRQRGSKNKKTIERELRAQLAVERFDAKSSGKKMAVEVLDFYMSFFLKASARVMPYKLNQQTKEFEPNPDGNRELFMEYSRESMSCAKDLAPYQSAKKAPVVSEPMQVTSSVRRITVDIFQNTGEHVARYIDGDFTELPPPPTTNGGTPPASSGNGSNGSTQH